MEYNNSKYMAHIQLANLTLHPNFRNFIFRIQHFLPHHQYLQSNFWTEKHSQTRVMQHTLSPETNAPTFKQLHLRIKVRKLWRKTIHSLTYDDVWELSTCVGWPRSDERLSNRALSSIKSILCSSNCFLVTSNFSLLLLSSSSMECSRAWVVYSSFCIVCNWS